MMIRIAVRAVSLMAALVGMAGIGRAGAQDAPVKREAGIKDYGLKPYVRVSQRLPHTEDRAWKLVCALPYNCQFQSWIQVEALAGKTLQLNSSNPLVLYLTPTETCVTTEGDHAYEAQRWVSREGAVYTIPAGVTVKAVQYRETGYDTTFAGSFQCNDEDYNILWRKAARTAYLSDNNLPIVIVGDFNGEPWEVMFGERGFHAFRRADVMLRSRDELKLYNPMWRLLPDPIVPVRRALETNLPTTPHGTFPGKVKNSLIDGVLVSGEWLTAPHYIFHDERLEILTHGIWHHIGEKGAHHARPAEVAEKDADKLAITDHLPIAVNLELK